MARFRVIVNISLNNLRLWTRNKRILVIAILAFIWIHYLVKPILRFSQSVNVSITPFVFPHLFLNWYSIMIMLLLSVLLFCDAPFMSSRTPYECVRSGRQLWIKGQIIYIFEATTLFVMFMIITSIACLSANIVFLNDWGKVLNTLAQTDIGMQFNIMPVSYFMMINYTPTEAMFLSFIMLVLIINMIGLIMLVLNMTISRVVGIFVALFLAFLPAFANVSDSPKLYYVIPTTWANITMFDIKGTSLYPSLLYAAISILVINLALCFTAVHLIKNRQVEIISH